MISQAATGSEFRRLPGRCLRTRPLAARVLPVQSQSPRGRGRALGRSLRVAVARPGPLLLGPYTGFKLVCQWHWHRDTQAGNQIRLRLPPVTTTQAASLRVALASGSPGELERLARFIFKLTEFLGATTDPRGGGGYASGWRGGKDCSALYSIYVPHCPTRGDH